MNLKAMSQTSLDALDSALCRAQEPTLDLLAKIISATCTRISLLTKTEKFNRLVELAKIGAWIEAAFALIALELPLWRVRPSRLRRRRVALLAVVPTKYTDGIRRLCRSQSRGSAYGNALCFRRSASQTKCGA
jgi:hypothetical protein